MNKIIQEHWNQKELLGIDCLMMSNDVVTMMYFYEVDEEGIKTYFTGATCDTTILSLEQYDDDIWTEIEVHPVSVKSENGNTYYCGEGGMGNEGFIACTDNKNNLQWAFFLTQSNPFIEIYLKDFKVIAISTLGLKFILDLENPKNIEIHNISKFRNN